MVGHTVTPIVSKLGNSDSEAKPRPADCLIDLVHLLARHAASEFLQQLAFKEHDGPENPEG